MWGGKLVFLVSKAASIFEISGKEKVNEKGVLKGKSQGLMVERKCERRRRGQIGSLQRRVRARSFLIIS